MPATALSFQTDDVINLNGPVGYIVSLKDGIPSFINREIEGLITRGVQVNLYATKIGKGVYSPRLPYFALTRTNVLIGNFSMMVTRPRGYLRALRKSVSLGSWREFFAGAAFARTMLKAHTLLIHCSFADRKLLAGYYASLLTGIPLTTMIHSHELTFYLDNPTFKEALVHASGIYAVCEANRILLAEKFPTLTNRISVVRLFVDPDIFLPDERAKVLTVAKFHDYKGYDVLAKAAAILKNEKVVFWIVGDGPLDVKRIFHDEKATNNVVFLGPVTEDVLKILYQNCDIFCLPSKTAPSGQKEGLPVTLMEAMATAKPVVSTIHAGIPELVPSKLVEEDKPEDLATAIKEYVDDKVLRQNDGTRNRIIVGRSYAPKNLDTLIESFAKIAARR